MITRSQKMRLGIFIAVSLLILLSLLATVVGSFLWERLDRYQIRYELSVSGLEIGAPVKYNGVRVGRVEEIWIDPKEVSKTIVSIGLASGTPLKENTRAILNIQGITGLRFIELLGGTSEANTLKPGSEIPAGTSVVDKLTGQAENITIKAEMLINQLVALTSDENRALVADVLERGASLMHNLDQMVSKNGEAVTDLIKNSSLASQRLAAALEEIRYTVQEGRETIGSVRKGVAELLESKRMTAIMDGVQTTVQQLQQRVGAGEFGKINARLEQLLVRTDALLEKLDLVITRSREDIQASLRFITEASENLRDFSRLIREDPSRLLKGQERRERVLP